MGFFAYFSPLSPGAEIMNMIFRFGFGFITERDLILELFPNGVTSTVLLMASDGDGIIRELKRRRR